MGWHEQWQTDANLSGIYASCEGIILLSLIKDKYRKREVKQLINNVYTNHLCKAFDVDYIIESGITELAQKMQRERAINLSNKLSKFLLASAYVDQDDRNSKVLHASIHRLSSMFVSKDKQFKLVPNKEKTSLASTVLAFVALKNFLPSDHEIIVLVKERLMEILGSKSNANDFISVILAAWAVSESIEMFTDEQQHTAADALIRAVNCQSKGDIISTEKFLIVDIIHHDSFSFNKCMLYMHTIISFIKAKLLDFDYIKLVLEDTQRIVEVVQSIGMYSRTGEISDVLFWENYQALLLINNFYELIKDREEAFMVINPKYFPQKDYPVDSNLVVALMPFRTEWSKTIFKVFEKALSGRKVWRSDLEHKDDIIMQSIWENINRAKFVIADCTGRNPNVFYELGIAHTIGKPVFVCAQNRDDIPFDINSIHNYVYGSEPADILKLISDIEEFMQEL